MGIKKYPADYSNKEIEEKIETHFFNAQKRQNKDGVVTYELEYARLGINELEKRKLRNQNIIVIVVATLTLLATLMFSLLDYYGDKSWQDSQLRELKEIKDILEIS